jgi:hypothetical protein
MTPEQFERIAEQVHIGWMLEKQRQGFADHAWKPQMSLKRETGWCAAYSGDCNKGRDKHHADMLPYAELAENIKEYDRATVRAVFAGIEKAGLQVVKR